METPQTPARKFQKRPWSALALPFVFTLLFLSLSFMPRVRENPRLLWAFLGSGAVLLMWLAWLGFSATRKGRTLYVNPHLVRVHWVQSLVHLSLYAYWGWHWRPVYGYAGLLLAQIVFSYAFIALLSWTRRSTWHLTLGVLPIIFSTNLFLWFKDDWFYLQFLMIGMGYLGKELIMWRREGRRTHIFNPSGFSLSVFSLGLLLTGSTNITWGLEIATTLIRPPYIYVFIFALGLVVQSLFSVTLTTLGAAIALLVLNLVYMQVTGVWWFFHWTIPIAVFLGLHLLVTDPVTSPRTDLGRLIFGALYGAGAFVLFGVLELFGAPEFYDKLLAVPILNLSVQVIDRFARSKSLARFRGEMLGLTMAAPKRNLIYMGVWIVLFAGMYTSGFTNVSKRDGTNKFWLQACDQNLPNACNRLGRWYNVSCDQGNGQDCNILGMLYAKGERVKQSDFISAHAFGRACEFGHETGCINAAVQYILHDIRYLKVQPLLSALHGACKRGHPQACFLMGAAHDSKRAVNRNPEAAQRLYRRSCNLGFQAGCKALAKDSRPDGGDPLE